MYMCQGPKVLLLQSFEHWTALRMMVVGALEYNQRSTSKSWKFFYCGGLCDVKLSYITYFPLVSQISWHLDVLAKCTSIWINFNVRGDLKITTNILVLRNNSQIPREPCSFRCIITRINRYIRNCTFATLQEGNQYSTVYFQKFKTVFTPE